MPAGINPLRKETPASLTQGPDTLPASTTAAWPPRFTLSFSTSARWLLGVKDFAHFGDRSSREGRHGMELDIENPRPALLRARTSMEFYIGQGMRLTIPGQQASGETRSPLTPHRAPQTPGNASRLPPRRSLVIAKSVITPGRISPRCRMKEKLSSSTGIATSSKFSAKFVTFGTRKLLATPAKIQAYQYRVDEIGASQRKAYEYNEFLNFRCAWFTCFPNSSFTTLLHPIL